MAYNDSAKAIWRPFERQVVRLAAAFAEENTGKSRAATIATMAITTRSSMKVKALTRIGESPWSEGRRHRSTFFIHPERREKERTFVFPSAAIYWIGSSEYVSCASVRLGRSRTRRIMSFGGTPSFTSRLAMAVYARGSAYGGRSSRDMDHRMTSNR